jgi:hypothetical protein
MNKETLRMQMLAGIITESQYKKRLNEAKDPDFEERVAREIAKEKEDAADLYHGRFKDVGMEDMAITGGVGDIHKEYRDSTIMLVRQDPLGTWSVAIYLTLGDHILTSVSHQSKEEAIEYGRDIIDGKISY